MILRQKVPNLPVSAELLGSVNLAECRPTVDALQDMTPSGPGYCSWIAAATDNPGYNVDAVPATPLKKVIATAGDGC